MKKYTTFDYYPLKGVSYYRLKQTDFDGKHSYSKIISTKYEINNEINLYPIPIKQGAILKIELEKDANDECLFCIYNNQGDLISIDKMIINNGSIEKLITLERGFYPITIVRKNQVFAKNLLVL